MKRDTINYLAVGVFVVIMAVAFTILMFAVSGRSGPTEHYVVYYDNVGGLKFGTAVFYEGYRVGQIESLVPEHGEGGVRYRIDFSVVAGWKIPVDSIARVRSSGLISAIAIEISEGQEKAYLQPGEIIEVQGQTDIFAVLNQAASDFRNLSENGVMPVLDNLNGRLSELSEEALKFRREDLTPFVKMMNDRVNQDLVNEALELLNHLDESAVSLKKLVGEGNQVRVRDFLGHIDDVAVNLNDLIARIETTRLQMSSVLSSLDNLVAENRKEVRETAQAAGTSMEELETALKTVNQHLGTILYNIEGSSRHMGEFARAIRDNPSRLIRNTPAAEAGSQ